MLISAQLLLFWLASNCVFAQVNRNFSGENIPFGPSLDTDSAAVYSSTDAARNNRPPVPSKNNENLVYPDNFLTLSKPTERKSERKGTTTGSNKSSSDVDKNESDVKSESESSRRSKEGRSLRPLDPNLETTPFIMPLELQKEANEGKRKKGDSVFFFAFSIALAGLGFFLYNDFRYRNQLRVDLARNARLCSSSASASDFDDLLATGDLTDPKAPSYANPDFDASALMGGSSSRAEGLGSLANLDDRFSTFEANKDKWNLHEENFDFVPKGEPSIPIEEPQEDFVVGSSPSPASSKTSLSEDAEEDE